ncbi:hypothetical protein Cgig2_013653 [Carnegiea gigantea]|uniref:non-specific serine/threonine protein kinase n=1 Tax=Carnegiea gigantea TaxID=171969 RepID=A0A9Q1JW09_9CARY|nr:hypothetical protein Cgig2_013653 [Carnegiea gigantea]
MSRQMTSSHFHKSKTLDNKYMLGDEIGKGAYGRVYKGLDLENGDFVAIKQVSLENIAQEDLNIIMCVLSGGRSSGLQTRPLEVNLRPAGSYVCGSRRNPFTGRRLLSFDGFSFNAGWKFLSPLALSEPANQSLANFPTIGISLEFCRLTVSASSLTRHLCGGVGYVVFNFGEPFSPLTSNLAVKFLELSVIKEGNRTLMIFPTGWNDRVWVKIFDSVMEIVEADFDFLNLPQALTNFKATGSGKKMENLLCLPFSEIFNMSSLFPTTLRSNDFLSIATNFLQPPSLHRITEETKEQDTNQTTPQAQCADKIPMRFWSLKKLSATDSPAQREPVGTETAGQPSLHHSRGENLTHGDRSEKNLPDECKNLTRKSRRRPVKGLQRLPKT